MARRQRGRGRSAPSWTVARFARTSASSRVPAPRRRANSGRVRRRGAHSATTSSAPSTARDAADGCACCCHIRWRCRWRLGRRRRASPWPARDWLTATSIAAMAAVLRCSALGVFVPQACSAGSLGSGFGAARPARPDQSRRAARTGDRTAAPSRAPWTSAVPDGQRRCPQSGRPRPVFRYASRLMGGALVTMSSTEHRYCRGDRRAVGPDMRAKALTIVRTLYADFGPTLAQEKLAELRGLAPSVETLRQWMVADGLWTTRRERRKRVQQPRHRRACLGIRVLRGDAKLSWTAR